jgi:hypothetical protein
MRLGIILCALLLAGCANAPPKVIIKRIVVPGPERIVYVPGPIKEVPVPGPIVEVPVPVYVTDCPPPKYCNKITDKDKCNGEQRCHWFEGKIRRHHCQQIQCKPPRT